MLTPEEIKARATSSREALVVSIEVWTERARTSEKELKQTVLAADKCGLCHYYGFMSRKSSSNHEGCPLHDVPGRVCCLEYHAASDVLEAWQDGKGNLTKVRIAFWSMVARLEDELVKLPEKKPEPKKEEPGHGDYKVTKGGSAQFFVRDDSHGPIRLCQEDYMFPGPANNWSIISDENVVDRGNFLNDLAALQEDVEDYENKSAIGFLRSHIDGNGRDIFIQTGGCGKSLSPDESLKFSLWLRQAVAQLKRKQLC